MIIDPVDALIESLRARQFAIVDNWVPEGILSGLRADILRQQKRHSFRPAGVGRGEEFTVNSSVRSDRLQWMTPDTFSEAQSLLFLAMDGLRVRLNRAFFLGLRHFEGHLTIYPPGASYQRHVDQFRGNPHRRVSFILYLNRHWSPGRGGELRLFDPSCNETFVNDVPPLWGRVVVFFSDAIPHEVLVTHQHRLSATGWFRDDEAPGL